MITTSMLVSELVCDKVSPAECDEVDNCGDCCAHWLTKHDESIRAEAIRKFAEWIEYHNESCAYVDHYGHGFFDAEKVLAEYEREGTNDREIL